MKVERYRGGQKEGRFSKRPDCPAALRRLGNRRSVNPAMTVNLEKYIPVADEEQ